MASPVYTDVGTLKKYLDKSRSDDDSWYEDNLLPAAEGFADRYCNRLFRTTGTVDVTKTFSTRFKSYVRIQDLRSATTVAINGAVLQSYYYDLDTSWGPATDIRLDPSILIYGQRTVGLQGVNDLAITGKFGWDPPPDELVDAVYVLASRMAKERDASYSDAVQAVEGVALTYFRQLPPRVQAVFMGWRVPNLALV